MSFSAPAPLDDACLVQQPPPANPPPGPPSPPPRVCHRPVGHFGVHSTDREPRHLAVTWTGGTPNVRTLINQQARARAESTYRDVLSRLDREGVTSDLAMPLAQVASELVRAARLDLGEAGLGRPVRDEPQA